MADASAMQCMMQHACIACLHATTSHVVMWTLMQSVHISHHLFFQIFVHSEYYDGNPIIQRSFNFSTCARWHFGFKATRY